MADKHITTATLLVNLAADKTLVGAMRKAAGEAKTIGPELSNVAEASAVEVNSDVATSPLPMPASLLTPTSLSPPMRKGSPSTTGRTNENTAASPSLAASSRSPCTPTANTSPLPTATARFTSCGWQSWPNTLNLNHD